jgi:thiamine-monophosphate kinase
MPIGEFDLIARHFAPWSAPGALSLLDDAAFFAPPAGHDLVLTKDMLVAGVHFFADDPARLIAMKSLRVNLSDLAAKGADPVGFLLGLVLPNTIDEVWLKDFAEGLAADSAAHGIALYGGDTVRTNGPLTVSITALGTVPSGRMVQRLAVKPGDALYVTGCIGDAALGLQLRLHSEAGWAKSLSSAARHWLLDCYLLPSPRGIFAPGVLEHAHACMDISDGFIGDMEKMLGGAGCGGMIHLADIPFSPAVTEAVRHDAALRKTALTGGDDYELIIAVPPENIVAFEAALVDHRLARIGTALPLSAGLHFLEADGTARHFERGSYRHF